MKRAGQIASLGFLLRYVLGIGVALLSLFPVLVGLSDVSMWLHLQSGEPYYGNRNYLEPGLPVMLVGLGMLILAGYVTLRRKISLQWLFVPFLVSMFMVIKIPSDRPHGGVHHNATRLELKNGVKKALVEWGKEHGRFPQNQPELELAAQYWEGIKPGEKIFTVYARRGQHVPYRFLYLGESSGPHLPHTLPQEPGVVYYTASPDARKFWLTATVLKQEVSTSIILLPDERGQIYSIEGSLEARL